MIAINGAFLCRRTTGVERYATRLLLNALQLGNGRRHFRLYLPTLPADGAPLELMLDAGADAIIAPRWARRRQLFEQIALPMMAYGDGAEVIVHLANALSIIAGTPQLTCLHDAAPFRFPRAYRRAYRAKTRAVFTRARRSRSVHVFTVSDFSAGELRSFGISPLAVCRAGPGLDPSGRAAVELPRRHFLVYGTIDARKRVGELLSWWQQSQELSAFELRTIGGQSPSHASCTSAASASLGYVSDADLEAEILTSRAVIFPSQYEGGGMAPLEVLQLGVPVICRDIPAYREYLGTHATYFHSRRDLVAAVNAAASNPQLPGAPALLRSGWTDAATRFLELVEQLTRR